MCVVCNVGDHMSVAMDFLDSFRRAGDAMKKANADMLEVAACAPGHDRQYRRIHKRMARLTREWNKIEHLREVKPVDTAS